VITETTRFLPFSDGGSGTAGVGQEMGVGQDGGGQAEEADWCRRSLDAEPDSGPTDRAAMRRRSRDGEVMRGMAAAGSWRSASGGWGVNVVEVGVVPGGRVVVRVVGAEVGQVARVAGWGERRGDGGELEVFDDVPDDGRVAQEREQDHGDGAHRNFHPAKAVQGGVSGGSEGVSSRPG